MRAERWVEMEGPGLGRRMEEGGEGAAEEGGRAGPSQLTYLTSSSSARVDFARMGEGASVAALGSPPTLVSSIFTMVVMRVGQSVMYMPSESGCCTASSKWPAMERSSWERPCERWGEGGEWGER